MQFKYDKEDTTIRRKCITAESLQGIGWACLSLVSIRERSELTGGGGEGLGNFEKSGF